MSASLPVFPTRGGAGTAACLLALVACASNASDPLTSVQNAGRGFAIAANYERDLVPTIFAPWAQKVIELALPRSGENVLDVGCGTGAVTRHLPSLVGASGRVVGLDIDPDMIAVAKTVPSEGPIEWIVASAEQIPLPDASCDLVTSQQVLQFVPDPDKALAEMWRVLKPGGRLVLSIWSEKPEDDPWGLAFIVALRRHLSGPASEEESDSAASPILAPENLRQALARANFRDIVTRPHTITTSVSSVSDITEKLIMSIPLSTDWQSATPAQRSAFLRDMETARAAHYVDGEFRMSSVSNLTMALK